MTNDKNSVYMPPEDEYDRFDIGDEDDSRRGPILLIVAIAILVAFIAVIYTAYNQGVRSGGRDDAPLILAAPGPIKSIPKDPGGVEQPSTSGAAYNALEKKPVEQAVTLAPPPEQPVKTAPAPQAIAKPVAKPIKPEPKLAPKPTPKPQTTITTNGQFVVQIGSFRSEKQALATWQALNKRLPALTNTSADVQRADLGAKGIYYRLRAAAFLERTSANEFCAQLKSKGQDCIVVSR